MKKILVFLLVLVPFLVACSAEKKSVNVNDGVVLDGSESGVILEGSAEAYPDDALPAENTPEEEAAITPITDEATFCTMDAKACADGSFVGRSGPNCEFDPCPEDMNLE